MGNFRKIPVSQRFALHGGNFEKIASTNFSLHFHPKFGIKIFQWISPLFSPQIFLLPHFHSISKQMYLFSLSFSLYPLPFSPIPNTSLVASGFHITTPCLTKSTSMKKTIKNLKAAIVF